MGRRELFVERRTEEGDYAIRKPGSRKASDVCDTQAEATDRAGRLTPTLPFWWRAFEIRTGVRATSGASRNEMRQLPKNGLLKKGSGRKQINTQMGMEGSALYFSRLFCDVCLISKEILGHLYTRDAQLDKCLQVRE
jgi:hypothetical protein